MLKPTPKGVDDFKKFFEKNLYYVDKTDMVRQILESPADVYLFTRPRRFGKTLNLSMLDAFFNMKYEGNTWFDGLKVSECDICDEHKNRYPVIYVDFKDVFYKDYESTKSMFRTDLQTVFSIQVSRGIR